MTPGIYPNISAEDYHKDPCSEPSLSSSIAVILCESSPAHARAAHPKLNPQAVNEEKKEFDIGTAAHSILLEGKHSVEVVNAPDWRTKIAQQQRDAAYAAGKVPLLAKVWADVQAMVAATRAQLDAHRDGVDMFKHGAAEQTLIWQEANGVWCRARVDWLRDGSVGPMAIDDYKTTSASADPEGLSRNIFTKGWDIQAAFYLRGLKALTGGQDAMFRFACQETYAPYALSVLALGPDAMTLAEKRVLYAIEHWGACLKSGKWPGYPTRTAYATLPPWIEAQWIAKEELGV